VLISGSGYSAETDDAPPLAAAARTSASPTSSAAILRIIDSFGSGAYPSSALQGAGVYGLQLVARTPPRGMRLTPGLADEKGAAHAAPFLCSFRDRNPGNSPPQVDERSARLAANEAIVRAGNERIDAMLGGQNETTGSMCECGDAKRFEQVELTNAEYEEVRSHPARFFVVSGHEDLTAGEVVVEEAPRFTIVERSNPRAAR
jgi:hypothetical protein